MITNKLLDRLSFVLAPNNLHESDTIAQYIYEDTGYSNLLKHDKA